MRAFLLILLFSWLLGLYLPWWSALIPCLLLGAWLIHNPANAFLSGFAAVGLAWLIQALYIHLASDGILTHRIADLMQTGSPAVIIGITFMIGALIGGFGTLTGFYFKKAFIA
jgi:hypothetical protein